MCKLIFALIFFLTANWQILDPNRPLTQQAKLDSIITIQKRERMAFMSSIMKKRKSRKNLKEMAGFTHKQDSVFGVPLSKLVAQQGTEIPQLVLDVFNFIEIKGLEFEGIFRISPAQHEVNEMVEEYNAGRTPDFSKMENIHAISGLLIYYLKSLPDPVFTFSLYDVWAAVIGLHSYFSFPAENI